MNYIESDLRRDAAARNLTLTRADARRREAAPMGRLAAWARRVGRARRRRWLSAAWRSYSQHRQVAGDGRAASRFRADSARREVRASGRLFTVTLPATTSAFTAANIFARASGYIDKRNVDIGDHVKEGSCWPRSPPPSSTIRSPRPRLRSPSSRRRCSRRKRIWSSPRVTWDRDRPLVEQGWVTQQQGTIDVQNLKAQRGGGRSGAKPMSTAQEAQLRVLASAEGLSDASSRRSTASITQRNIDVGSLVQADAASGTFMFTIMQSNVIRTQVYVPQDQAFGVAPGVDAVVRVPELPVAPSRQSDADRRRAAAWHAHAADRNRHTQSRRALSPGSIARSSSIFRARRPVSSGAGRCDHFQSQTDCRSP